MRGGSWFQLVAVLTALAFVALFVILLVNSAGYIGTYGLAPDAGADFMARRAAPMFIGLAVLLWWLRDLPAGTARDGVCFGMAALWCGIAVTGLYEFVRGQAGFAIVIAAAAELLAAAAFLWVRKR